jgi:serine/threonine protein kinase
VFRHLGKERKLSRKCGTPPYIAPEVFAGLEYHAEPADIWSCGIVLVALLAGGEHRLGIEMGMRLGFRAVYIRLP